MKICTITNPNSIHSYRWVEYFIKKGHKVDIVHFKSLHVSKKVDLDLKNVNVYRVIYFSNFLRILQLPFEFIQLLRILKKSKPDILDAKYVSTRGWYGALLNFHPYVLHVWGSDIDRDPEVSATARKKVEYALSKADYIRAFSDNAINQVIKFGGSRDKIINQPDLGVDTELFTPKVATPTIREKYNAQTSPLIICTRMLKPIYNIETYLRAIPEVLKVYPTAKFIQAGIGMLEPKLKKLAKELGIKDSIYFTGKIPHDELPEHLASADVFVDPFVPHKKGGGGPGQGSREAWSCGVATIHAGPNSLMAIVIKDGYNGSLFKGNDPKDLAKKIIFLIENKNLRKLFGKRSRSKMREMYEFSKNMSKLEKKYLAMVKKFKK